MKFQRFGVYFTPEKGALSEFGASWLGWDLNTGAPAQPKKPEGLPLDWDQITAAPRKYGFHATIKPPFFLAPGHTLAGLEEALHQLCTKQAPVILEGLELARLGRFLALVPTGDAQELNALAAQTVRELDCFRAPPSDAELAKRRASGLSAEQDALLLRWGYPHVMQAFRFHMTLSGKLPKPDAEAVKAVLAPLVAPVLPRPFAIDALSLVGEDASGRFHCIHRFMLSG